LRFLINEKVRRTCGLDGSNFQRFIEMGEAERRALVQEGLRRLEILKEEGKMPAATTALHPKNK
jgi:hypothetical protein